MSIGFFFQVFGLLSLLFIGTVISLHLYYWAKRRPMKLNSDSFVVIIGSCTGIGKQLAMQLAKKYNPRLLLVDFRIDLFQSVQEEIKKVSSAQIQTYPCDLTKSKSVEGLVEFLNDKGRKIDMMIYNAAIYIPKCGWEFTDQERHDYFNVNFLSSIPIFSGTMKLLEGGNFCLTASISVHWPGTPSIGAYQATKAALVMYYTAIRHELMINRIPISISIAAPAGINTQMTQNLVKKEFEKKIPMMPVEKGAQEILKGFIYRKQLNTFPLTSPSMLPKIYGILPSELYYGFAQQMRKSIDVETQLQRILRQRKEIKQKLK